MMMETFLPSMREMVSRRLSREGVSQGKISRLLGITQASVSYYLSKDSTESYRRLSSMSISREEAERYASLLADDVKKGPVTAVSTLYSIWSNALGQGRCCAFHRSAYPSLAECDVCMRIFGREGSISPGARDHVAKAAELLESSGSFARLIPEVSVNIAYAEGDPKTPADVVAIPGRIVRVKDSARSLSRPEYGASSHLARILLLVRKKRRDVHAVMNVKFERRVARALSRLGLRTMHVGGRYPKGAVDPVVEGMRQRLESVNRGFDVIVDRGGPGLEPSLYLLGEDAIKVAELGIGVSRAYSKV